MISRWLRQDKRDERKRIRLNALQVSLDCGTCPVPAGTSCDPRCPHGTMVRLNLDPLLFAHVSRILAVLARRPDLRELIIAQFEDGDVPAGLTGESS